MIDQLRALLAGIRNADADYAKAVLDYVGDQLEDLVPILIQAEEHERAAALRLSLSANSWKSDVMRGSSLFIADLRRVAS